MEQKKSFVSFPNGEVNSMNNGISLDYELQRILSQFWNSLNDKFVLKSEVEALIQKAVHSIKCEMKDEKEMLSISEAAEYLQVSKSSVYKLTSTHQIPFYKPNGKMIYILRQDLIDWIKKYPCKSMQQIEAAADAYIRDNKFRGPATPVKMGNTKGMTDVQIRNRQLAMEIRRKYSH